MTTYHMALKSIISLEYASSVIWQISNSNNYIIGDTKKLLFPENL